MKPFNWEIGEVPEGWDRSGGAPRGINFDFAKGPWAAMLPPAAPYPGGVVDCNLCAYQFHYDQRVKVKIWLDWFMKEFDE